MSTIALANRLARSLARIGRRRTYGSPRHMNDYMLKDIGLSADDLGTTRRH